ncbi:hypothetical protein B0H15DRAFT_968248 [Mycena belliarum]|uniref:Uncharacterized protein n=1 Tax=Mycena belliarum TaxID=1033014 RepID=A0AAD6XGF6_9AGAR|nr:hypothetical protein B0H15DRAFT_968248 [Mycena belliae]
MLSFSTTSTRRRRGLRGASRKASREQLSSPSPAPSTHSSTPLPSTSMHASSSSLTTSNAPRSRATSLTSFSSASTSSRPAEDNHTPASESALLSSIEILKQRIQAVTLSAASLTRRDSASVRVIGRGGHGSRPRIVPVTSDPPDTPSPSTQSASSPAPRSAPASISKASSASLQPVAQRIVGRGGVGSRPRGLAGTLPDGSREPARALPLSWTREGTVRADVGDPSPTAPLRTSCASSLQFAPPAHLPPRLVPDFGLVLAAAPREGARAHAPSASLTGVSPWSTGAGADGRGQRGRSGGKLARTLGAEVAFAFAGDSRDSQELYEPRLRCGAPQEDFRFATAAASPTASCVSGELHVQPRFSFESGTEYGDKSRSEDGMPVFAVPASLDVDIRCEWHFSLSTIACKIITNTEATKTWSLSCSCGKPRVDVSLRMKLQSVAI